MISRRQVLIAGSLMSAGAACLPASADVLASADAGLSLFLIERSVPAGAAAADFMVGVNIPVAAFGGDVGVPWLELLQPAWRENPRPIGGLTFGGALFCLEQLGAPYGLTCTQKLVLPASRPIRFDAVGQALLQAAAAGRPRRRNPYGQIGDAPIAWLLQPLARNLS